MDAELEGLALVDNGARYAGTADEVIEASGREAWRGLRGEAILSVAVAWHVSGQDCPESLWGVRLSFSARSILIALGTANPGLKYMPDELVVVFDPSLADSYRPHHVHDRRSGHRANPFTPLCPAPDGGDCDNGLG